MCNIHVNIWDSVVTVQTLIDYLNILVSSFLFLRKFSFFTSGDRDRKQVVVGGGASLLQSEGLGGCEQQEDAEGTRQSSRRVDQELLTRQHRSLVFFRLHSHETVAAVEDLCSNTICDARTVTSLHERHGRCWKVARVVIVLCCDWMQLCNETTTLHFVSDNITYMTVPRCHKDFRHPWCNDSLWLGI